ncbi:MAG: hypothetical protein GY951_05735 [Psychromonas sp.]|nr:hypothetical protein [Alteromonadales bacterium]MCP5077542.1 hypothetical protein [Psychromonas sp.]
MDWLKRKIKFIFAIVALLSTLIKLFTSVVALHDDPSVFFVIRIVPSLENYLVANSEELSNYMVLALDENGLIGESFYELLTGYLWWLFLGVLVIDFLIRLCKKSN